MIEYGNQVSLLKSNIMKATTINILRRLIRKEFDSLSEWSDTTPILETAKDLGFEDLYEEMIRDSF